MAKAKQTGKQAKAATENAAERGKAGKGANPSNASGSAIVSVSKAALSTDVGPKVVAMLDRAKNDEAKARDVLAGVAQQRYDAIAITTMAIVKAAQADKRIQLADAFSGDKKKMGALNDLLGLALGFREVVTVVDGDKTLQRVVPAKAIAKYFPTADEDKETDEYARKDTLRSNFLTLIKHSAQGAEGIIVKGLKASMDKNAGTLRIAGPAVKAAFGADSVLLNQKLDQGGAKPLTAKPSFTAIRAIGAEAHDAAVSRSSNTRGGSAAISAAKIVDPDVAFQSMAGQVIMAIGKFAGPLAGKTKEAAEMLYNALGAKLKQTA